MTTNRKSWDQLKNARRAKMTPAERDEYEQHVAAVSRALRLGLEVKARREAAGLSQRELAERCGLHQPTIARIEAGRVTPTLRTLDRVAAALDLAVEIDFGPAHPASAKG